MAASDVEYFRIVVQPCTRVSGTLSSEFLLPAISDYRKPAVDALGHGFGDEERPMAALAIARAIPLKHSHSGLILEDPPYFVGAAVPPLGNLLYPVMTLGKRRQGTGHPRRIQVRGKSRMGRFIAHSVSLDRSGAVPSPGCVEEEEATWKLPAHQEPCLL